jgi:aerobic carbon-monoxide dehydrogenase medium subunit
MIPKQFDYAAPESLDEALALLGRNTGARVLAGGHDLLTEMKLRRAMPPFVVDLRNIRDLHGITHSASGTTIGALTTCSELVADSAIRASGLVLVEAAESIGDVQVRNCATIGGNLAFGDPAADLPAALLVLDATIQVAGPRGRRTIPADQFFVNSFKTALEPGEIITAVEIPAAPAGTGSAYEKFRNPANGYPICAVAARVVRAPNGVFFNVCRLAITGASAHPVRLRNVETAIEGKAQLPETIAAACAKAADSLSPVTDLYASGEYRGHLAAVLTERALTRAGERAKSR